MYNFISIQTRYLKSIFIPVIQLYLCTFHAFDLTKVFKLHYKSKKQFEKLYKLYLLFASQEEVIQKRSIEEVNEMLKLHELEI